MVRANAIYFAEFSHSKFPVVVEHNYSIYVRRGLVYACKPSLSLSLYAVVAIELVSLAHLESHSNISTRMQLNTLTPSTCTPK